jgi:hypothetical protein
MSWWGMLCAGPNGGWHASNVTGERSGRPPPATAKDAYDTVALNSLDIDGGKALRAILYIKVDRLTVQERFETAALDRAEVDEHIASIFGFNEAEALAFVEPFDFALHHRFPPFLNFSRADYDDAKKNHHTLKSAVVKPTLQNVFIQPLTQPAGLLTGRPLLGL